MIQKKYIKTLIILTILMFNSCSHKTSIGLKNHNFSTVPKQIVWIQIPGLMYQHLVLRFFESPSPINYSVWNQFDCIGNSWAYNLYKIRPNNRDQSLSQLTGNINIKGQCGDYGYHAVWDYLKVLGYFSLVIEKVNKASDSLLSSHMCKNNNFLKNIAFLLMNKKFDYLKDSNLNFFHYQTSQDQFELRKVYLDKTCQMAECISSINDNFERSWDIVQKHGQKSFILIRDFSYEKNLKNKNILGLRQSLLNLEKLIKHVLSKRQKYPDLLLVLSTMNGRRIEFPVQGKKWKGLYENGEYAIFKNKSLYNTYFSKGAKSENFCGMFNDNSVIDRFIQLDESVNFQKDKLFLGLDKKFKKTKSDN